MSPEQKGHELVVEEEESAYFQAHPFLLGDQLREEIKRPRTEKDKPDLLQKDKRYLTDD